MVDRLFSLPRLARLYDPLAPDRRDLAAYIVMLEDLGARSVLDIGCGTGTFALMLAQRGLSVIGLDPAKASLDVARGKPGSESVRWVQGEAATPLKVSGDAVTMTGNVAHFAFPDGSLVTSSSTLRFRSRGEVLAGLIDAGFEPGEVRDAPDRPGQEFVFLARRPHDSV